MDKHIEALIKDSHGHEWRIMPDGTPPQDKHQAEMKLIEVWEYRPDILVASGFIYNDSRHLFLDGEEVSTSYIVDRYEIDGVRYIETRNTLYKLI